MAAGSPAGGTQSLGAAAGWWGMAGGRSRRVGVDRGPSRGVRAAPAR
jgi:hypothetical protein